MVLRIQSHHFKEQGYPDITFGRHFQEKYSGYKVTFYLECMQEGYLGYKAIILFGILFGMRMQE